MLQRAASNAYSWWWASNIRTKQSKWLDSNLQEMEEKVKTIVKLIDVDADSFAKKAEMYYQKRPELIKFVEETYKAYKALADRYDRLSGELHKANHTLASAFPDQFQFAMQDDDEDGSPRALTDLDTSKFRKALPGEVPQIKLGNKSRDTLAALKKHHKKVTSHITKENAQNEIDRLQKEILVLQTQKEFVKSSYESSLAKFWEIESQITDFQDEVCNLQDEYSASSIIEDNEAQALMAARAIISCAESLVSLQLQEKKSGEMAKMEFKRIRELKNKLKFFKGENCSPEIEENFDKEISNKEGEGFHLKNEGGDLYSVCAQVKQHFQMNSHTSVVDLAEKIDELVEKVISLEVTVSLQTARIHTLRSETDTLQKHLRGLEEDKANLIVDSNSLNVRLRQAEDELHGVQDLEKVMHHEKGIFQTHFLEACNSLNDISRKLQSPSPKEKDGISASSNIENLEQNKEVKGEVRDEKGDAAAEEDAVLVKQEVEPNAIDTKDPLHSNEPSKGASSSQKGTQMQNKEENGSSIQVLTVKPDSPFKIVDIEEEIKVCYLDQQHSTSPIEEKFRAELDALLDENLNFWLKFSTSYHHIHKFEASFKELQAGLDKIKDPKEGGSAPASPMHSSKQDTTPLDKKLRELHTELHVWLEQNELLKGELQCRFTSLCNIQEEISKASRDTEGEDSKFTPYQAAKFQGELLNMQQENNKVAMELQTGLDHVKALQSQVAKALSKLRESFDLSVSNGYQQYQNFRHCSTRSKVPLRTFLFGEKRKKSSIFSCMSPALHRHHSQMKSGFPS